MSDDAPDLAMISTLLRQALAEVVGMRADVAALTALMMRRDAPLSALEAEVRSES